MIVERGRNSQGASIPNDPVLASAMSVAAARRQRLVAAAGTESTQGLPIPECEGAIRPAVGENVIDGLQLMFAPHDDACVATGRGEPLDPTLSLADRGAATSSGRSWAWAARNQGRW